MVRSRRTIVMMMADLNGGNQRVYLISGMKNQRRPRKHPLFAIRDLGSSVDQRKRDQSSRFLNLSTMKASEKERFFGDLTIEFSHFLESATYGWKDGEKFKRFNVLGEVITCARWQGEYYVSGGDIVKALLCLYRLDNQGKGPNSRKQFEEGVMGDLRTMKLGAHLKMEDANSPLLRFLYSINCVRTHKRQKIYKWEAVSFMRLYQIALTRYQPSLPLSASRKAAATTRERRESFSSEGQSDPQSWDDSPRVLTHPTSLEDNFDHRNNSMTDLFLIAEAVQMIS